MTSQDEPSNHVPVATRSSSQGFMPLQIESQTSCSSSPVPVQENAQKNDLHSVSDISQDETAGCYTSSEGIKSSHQVGELFDDSLQHVLKINSISAGLKSKYLHPRENTKDTCVFAPFGRVDNCNESGKNASELVEKNEGGKFSDATESLVLVSRSQDFVASEDQLMKCSESEPSLAKKSDETQNCNANSQSVKDSCEVSLTSSNHSFYATPSTSDHRPLNETFQINVKAQPQSHGRVTETTSSVEGGIKTSLRDAPMDSEVSANGMPVVIQVRKF